MSQLSLFSAEDQEKIISLPFKAGISVSYAEDEDGEGDDERETKALEAALSYYAKKDERTPQILQEIAVAILDRKADWGHWSEGVFQIETACEAAVKVLKPEISENDLRAYIKMVLDIATRVAQAFGEFGMGAEEPKGVMGFVKKIIKGNADMDKPMNVSAAEDDTIARITKALKKYA